MGYNRFLNKETKTSTGNKINNIINIFAHLLNLDMEI